MQAAAAAAMAVVVVSLATTLTAAGPMKLYERSTDETFKQVLVPVSSTVIPLEDLPAYKVGVGLGVASPIVVDEKVRPEGPVKLVTIHSLKNKNKNKKAETEEKARAALIEELTEEEYKTLTQQKEK